MAKSFSSGSQITTQALQIKTKIHSHHLKPVDTSKSPRKNVHTVHRQKFAVVVRCFLQPKAVPATCHRHSTTCGRGPPHTWQRVEDARQHPQPSWLLLTHHMAAKV